MDALRRPNLYIHSPISSLNTKTPQTSTSILPYKYRFSSYSSFSGYHRKCKASPPPQAIRKSNESVESSKKLVDSIAKGLIGLAAAVSSVTIAFPASRTHEVNAVQRTLVETWGLIRETFNQKIDEPDFFTSSSAMPQWMNWAS
ncbi:hypothetical protein LXL04_006546 [Taraxacum kok-saghyz]